MAEKLPKLKAVYLFSWFTSWLIVYTILSVFHFSAAGIKILNTVSNPGVDSADMYPPWFLSREYAVDIPNPLEFSFVVKKGSNSLSIIRYFNLNIFPFWIEITVTTMSLFVHLILIGPC